MRLPYACALLVMIPGCSGPAVFEAEWTLSFLGEPLADEATLWFDTSDGKSGERSGDPRCQRIGVAEAEQDAARHEAADEERDETAAKACAAYSPCEKVSNETLCVAAITA